MAKLSFSFERPFDEIEINNKIYRLYYDDESLKKYQKAAVKYSNEAESYAKKIDKLPDMSEDKRKAIEDEGMVFIREFIELFYGKDSYDSLYEASGKAMINFMPLIEYTLGWLDSKIPDAQKAKKVYYTKKRKK